LVSTRVNLIDLFFTSGDHPQNDLALVETTYWTILKTGKNLAEKPEIGMC
jgi:cobalamin biosynthesis Co2+ chelatase CbiK